VPVIGSKLRRDADRAAINRTRGHTSQARRASSWPVFRLLPRTPRRQIRGQPAHRLPGLAIGDSFQNVPVIDLTSSR